MIMVYLSGTCTTALQALLQRLAYLRGLATAEDSSPDWITRRTKASARKWARKHNYVGCVDARVQSIYQAEEQIEGHRAQPRPPRARAASEATIQEFRERHLLLSGEKRAGLTGGKATRWVHLRSASTQKNLEVD